VEPSFGWTGIYVGAALLLLIILFVIAANQKEAHTHTHESGASTLNVPTPATKFTPSLPSAIPSIAPSPSATVELEEPAEEQREATSEEYDGAGSKAQEATPDYENLAFNVAWQTGNLSYSGSVRLSHGSGTMILAERDVSNGGVRQIKQDIEMISSSVGVRLRGSSPRDRYTEESLADYAPDSLYIFPLNGGIRVQLLDERGNTAPVRVW
jgi:hypothetical protein